MPSTTLARRTHARPIMPLLAIVAMMLTLMAAVGVGRAAATSSDCHPYPDVDSSNSACANITWLKGQDITKPADGRYHPKADVTRGSMAAFLFRLTHPGQASPRCSSAPFPDVPVGNVFCGYIQWAKANHIAFGYPDGSYGPDRAVTRGAMAAYLFRIVNPGRGASTCTSKPFSDVPTGDTFCGVITWMASTGITYGVGGDRYGTRLPVTRQAMASFLHRVAHRMKGIVGPGTAAAVLATLTVKGKAPMTGYDRVADFGPAWTDDNGDPDGHNGCRTRDDILARDLTAVTTSNGCLVLSGTLVDPYTGSTIHFHYGVGTSDRVQIDHVVALGNAWQSGAKKLTRNQRIDLANDPLNLLAVDGPTNESKGDRDAAAWLPPNKSYRCSYVARQIAVKAKYHLSVTSAEKAAMNRVLTSCPGQAVPAEGQNPPVVTPTRPSTPPTTTPTKPKPPTGSCEPGYSPCLPITDDLNCSDVEAMGLAPVTVTGSDPYRLDGNGDGIACTG